MSGVVTQAQESLANSPKDHMNRLDSGQRIPLEGGWQIWTWRAKHQTSRKALVIKSLAFCRRGGYFPDSCYHISVYTLPAHFVYVANDLYISKS